MWDKHNVNAMSLTNPKLLKHRNTPLTNPKPLKHRNTPLTNLEFVKHRNTTLTICLWQTSNSYSTENTPLTNGLSQTSNANKNTLLINLIEYINNKISICMSRNRIATTYGGLNELKKALVYLIAVSRSAAQI